MAALPSSFSSPLLFPFSSSVTPLASMDMDLGLGMGTSMGMGLGMGMGMGMGSSGSSGCEGVPSMGMLGMHAGSLPGAGMNMSDVSSGGGVNKNSSMTASMGMGLGMEGVGLDTMGSMRGAAGMGMIGALGMTDVLGGAGMKMTAFDRSMDDNLFSASRPITMGMGNSGLGMPMGGMGVVVNDDGASGMSGINQQKLLMSRRRDFMQQQLLLQEERLKLLQEQNLHEVLHGKRNDDFDFPGSCLGSRRTGALKMPVNVLQTRAASVETGTATERSNSGISFSMNTDYSRQQQQQQQQTTSQQKLQQAAFLSVAGGQDSLSLDPFGALLARHKFLARRLQHQQQQRQKHSDVLLG
eukprot:TRINITY_DN2977_c0_g2_i1.p1 TRINITY_DN2977_c0_g2~~TRINITY_DN2977_c0_g2_i1.p1  ORF type:complete len:382 (+),score=67.40 TRINITY_DN2977_c0_g2_i1:85-1146(+)